MSTVCGMTWEHMDARAEFDKRDAADLAQTLSLVEGSNLTAYYVYRPDLSWGKRSDKTPRFLSVTHIYVKPSQVAQFVESNKRIDAAMDKGNYQGIPSSRYALANGGVGPEYVAVSPRNSWSDMTPPKEGVEDVLKRVYGKDDKTLQAYRETVDHVVSELLEYRPDLSYTPEK